MSVTEQLLYLVVVPAVVVAVVWALASLGGPQAKKRYRPGRPYEFTPVWFVANHRGREPDREPRLEPGREPDPERRRLEASEASSGGVAGGATGGASDRW